MSRSCPVSSGWDGRLAAVLSRRWRHLVGVIALVVGVLSPWSFAADWTPEVRQALQKGVAYFQKNAAAIHSSNAGIVAYACLSAGEPEASPVVATCIGLIQKKITGSEYKPTGHHTYEAGTDAMALAAANAEKYRDQLKAISAFILREQRPHGGWDYLGEEHGGDTSVSQYGMLGLWAASRGGVEIPIKAWDQAAQWHLKSQLRDGAFGYQPFNRQADPKHSMTVAGIGSLCIARIYLSQAGIGSPAPVEEEDPSKKSTKAFGILDRASQRESPEPTETTAPVVNANYKPQVTRKGLDEAINRGMGWLTRMYTIDKPIGWQYYYLYGLERAASLTSSPTIGKNDWYAEGSKFVVAKQGENGTWNDIGGEMPSTAFAMLFLARATEKIAPKPMRVTAPTYGGGQLSGGRGLPSDLSNVDTKGGQVTAKKMDTPIDKLLAVLENPKSQQIESAQASLVEAVQIGKREELIGQKDLLIKLTKDSRVEVRRTAFWALGRCSDLRVAPLLIQGLDDPEYDVVVEARNSLCLLSRRPRGFGLPEDILQKLPENTPQAERDAALDKWHREDVRRWKEWYQSVRPYEERDRLPE